MPNSPLATTRADQLEAVVPLTAALLGIAFYLVLFFDTRLPTVEDQLKHQRDRAGSSAASASGPTEDAQNVEDEQDVVFRRGEMFVYYLLLPENLAVQWLATEPERPGREGTEPHYELEFSLVDRLPVLAMAGLILTVAYVVGWLLIALCRADRSLTGLESFVFSMAVGLNAVSTYVLLVGLLGLLDSLLVFVLPPVLALGAAGWLRHRREARPSAAVQGQLTGRVAAVKRSEPSGKPADEVDVGLSPQWLWLGAPFVLVILLGGMLPPIEFDVREYHLQAPKEFFQQEQGRIDFLPHNLYGNMALGTEMLSLLGMVIARDWWLGALVGKTVIAAFAPLGALGLLAAGRRLFSPTAGIVAALVYISTPWIVQVSTTGYVEGASACYLFLALYAVLLWQRGPRSSGAAGAPGRGESGVSRMMLAGYLAGGAVSSKYPAVLFVALPLAVWILMVHFPARWRKAWKPVGVFLLAVGLGCGLWFGKNWVLTGNPTYPLMYNLFGGKTWTAEKNRYWNRVHQPHDFSAAALRADLARVVLRSEWLSPVVIPLAALAFMVRAKRRLSLGLLAYFGYMIATWWLFTHRIDRFWIPVLPLVALLAGAGACWSRERIWRWVLIGLLLFGSVFTFLVATSGPGGYNRYFVSLPRLRSAPERVGAWHRYLNRHAADGRVLLVGEADVFDLEVPILYNTWLDDSIFERFVRDPAARASDPPTKQLLPAGQIRAALCHEGISHVYVHWADIARYRRTGYGCMDFLRPEVFDRLVELGVLEPWPEDPPAEIRDYPWRGYRVVAAGRP
jgi:hypothetical protein